MTPHDSPSRVPPRMAIIGGGPVGLSLALLMRQRCPQWSVTVFDQREADRDLAGDPRTLALSLGSVQLLERLRAWPAADAAPIREVQVSQAPPTLSTPFGEPVVRMRADEFGIPMLGAVLGYGTLVTPLQRLFLAACTPDDGPGLHARFGQAVAAVRTDGGLATVATAGGAPEAFDLALIAEGGVFSEQARKAVVRDYHQTAWVGTVTLQGGAPDLAIERFTRDGPLALLPLPAAGAAPGTRRAALVWCVPAGDDCVAPLDDSQRLALLAARLPAAAGRPLALGPLKSFALGLNAESGLVDGRVVRIGNAAQTLHPVAGQGFNLGLRDAWHVADRLLAHAADADAGVARTLRGLAFGRAPDRWSIIGATDFLARSFTWDGPALAAARSLGLGTLQALPPLKRAFARHMMFGWR